MRADPEALARLGVTAGRRRGAADGLLAGRHRGVRGAFSAEFAGHRPFSPGDDPRRVDWRQAARSGAAHADAAASREPGGGLFVKQYEAETGLAVHLVLDAWAGMAYRGPAADGTPVETLADPHPTKWRYAAAAAATVAAAALRGRDAVSLTALGGRDERGRPVPPLPPSAAAPHLAAACALLDGVVPAGGAELPAQLTRAADRFTRRGTVLIVSDLLCEPGKLHAVLARLAARGHEPALLRVLAPAEVGFPFDRPRRFAPLGGGAALSGGGAAGRAAYRAAFERHAAALAAACRRRGAPLASCTTDEPLAAALARLPLFA